MKFRQQYTVEKKLKVIDYHKTHTNKQTALHFGINKSQVSKWRKNEVKLRAAKKRQIKLGSGRRAKYSDQEKLVYERAAEERKQGCCVSYASMARDMRETVNSIHPNADFKASSGWIKGMKKRYPSTSRVPNLLIPASKWNNEIDASAITEKHVGQIKEFFTFLNKGKELHNYKPENIINCDETPVYFNNVAKKTVHFGDGDIVAAKIMEGNPQARVSVMLATTSNGKLLEPCMIEASQSKAAKTDGGSIRYRDTE